MTKKKRAKNEPTKGDLLAQNYRNRAAMRRVFDATVTEYPVVGYWTPYNMDEYPFIREVNHGT